MELLSTAVVTRTKKAVKNSHKQVYMLEGLHYLFIKIISGIINPSKISQCKIS